jgi:hypothetical protein
MIINKLCRVLVISLLFASVSLNCIAPTIEFNQKMVAFRKATVVAVKMHHESEYQRFIKDLGYSESSNNWLCINRIGCFGEWQFSESTLRTLGYRHITLRKFKADPQIFPPELQRKVLESLIRVNLNILRNYHHFIGDTIRNVVVTKSGMIAASHLGGAGSLKSFLKTNGRINRRDVLGTSIRDYLRRFDDYELD